MTRYFTDCPHILLNPIYRYEERKNKILATVQRPTFSEYSELTFRPYTNSIPFFFNHQRRWDLVLILESLYYNTYMMRYIAQALFRVFCSGFVESMQCRSSGKQQSLVSYIPYKYRYVHGMHCKVYQASDMHFRVFGGKD